MLLHPLRLRGLQHTRLGLLRLGNFASADACAIEDKRRQIEAIIYEEKMIGVNGIPTDAEGLRRLKAMGFSDKRLATLAVDQITGGSTDRTTIATRVKIIPN